MEKEILILIFGLVISINQAAGANDNSSLSNVTFIVNDVIVAELPVETEIRNYEPDLDSTAISYIIIKTNCPGWTISSKCLYNKSYYGTLDIGKEASITHSRIKVGGNARVTLCEIPKLVSIGCQGINREDLEISQRNSWSGIISSDYENTVMLISAPIV